MGIAESALIILALVLMLLGLLFSFIPFIPGPLVVWGVGIVCAALTDFDRVTLLAAALMTALMIAGSTSDLWLPPLGMQMQGGSCLTSLGSVAGGLLGTFVIPIPLVGTVAGMVIGALLVEFMRVGEVGPAMQAGRAAFKFYLWGIVVEFTASVGILLVFAISVWITR